MAGLYGFSIRCETEGRTIPVSSNSPEKPKACPRNPAHKINHALTELTSRPPHVLVFAMHGYTATSENIAMNQYELSEVQKLGTDPKSVAEKISKELWPISWETSGYRSKSQNAKRQTEFIKTEGGPGVWRVRISFEAAKDAPAREFAFYVLFPQEVSLKAAEARNQDSANMARLRGVMRSDPGRLRRPKWERPTPPGRPVAEPEDEGGEEESEASVERRLAAEPSAEQLSILKQMGLRTDFPKER